MAMELTSARQLGRGLCMFMSQMLTLNSANVKAPNLFNLYRRLLTYAINSSEKRSKQVSLLS